MTNKQRYSVIIEPDLLEQLTQYRHKRGITSQSKAIQTILYDALNNGIPVNEKKPDLMTESGLDRQERELIRIARELDPAYKTWLVRLVKTAVNTRPLP